MRESRIKQELGRIFLGLDLRRKREESSVSGGTGVCVCRVGGIHRCFVGDVSRILRDLPPSFLLSVVFLLESFVHWCSGG